MSARLVRRALTLLGAVMVLTALLGVAAPIATAGTGVAAHPFGNPQTVEVGRSGGTVQVVWRVGMADDLTLLGISLGVLPEDRVMLDGAITYEDGDAAAVADSDELHGYLVDRIRVVADGVACPGEVVAVGDLITDGATLQFSCAPAPTEADVEVTTLLDLHEAYRTLASGPAGQRAVYGSDATSHSWQLPEGSAVLAAATAPDATAPDGAGAADSDSGSSATDGPGLGRSAVLQIGAVLGVLLVLLLAGALWLRRHHTAPSHH
ncbi:hypothetical protein [Nocardioides sambongensis]|uniref:hypothetical protein n=1 Tax=Nocardioides sambongensis TaxID=2589074 RepID=UPI00112E3671|nr:hypothetical protein [Nocardioides sambongensis]